MDQHPSTNGVPHLQLLRNQLEGHPATAVRCDGAKIPYRLEEGEAEGGGEGEGRGQGIVVHMAHTA